MPSSPLPPASDLAAHLGFWLRQVSNQVSRSFAARLAAREVSVAEWVLLRLLYGAAPTAPSRLADAMGMTRGAITKLADRLLDRGLLLRAANREDGRAQTLTLTAAGEGLVPLLAAEADANDAAFFDHLSAGERRALERLLRRTVERHGLAGLPLD